MLRLEYRERISMTDKGMLIIHTVWDNYLERPRTNLNSKYACKRYINKHQEELIDEED